MCHEVKHSQFVNIAVHNQVNQHGEVLLLVAFVVYHDRLKEGVCLVERQEPMAYAMQILAAVEQRNLGEVNVKPSLYPVLQVTSSQRYDALKRPGNVSLKGCGFKALVF